MLKAAGIGGSLLVAIALLIAFLKSAIAFIGFITIAIKILIVIVFIAVFVGVAFLVFNGIKNSRRKSD